MALAFAGWFSSCGRSRLVSEARPSRNQKETSTTEARRHGEKLQKSIRQKPKSKPQHGEHRGALEDEERAEEQG